MKTPKQNNPSTINNPSIKYKYIIDHLNEMTGSSYKYTTKKTQVSINARLKEGFTLEDFKQVIDYKTKEWKGTDYEQFLRPETLFGTKFEGYLQSSKKKQKYNLQDDYNNFVKSLEGGKNEY